MKSHITDIVLSIVLLGFIGYHLQQKPILRDDIPLQNENQEVFTPKDLSIIHFWAPWSKPSVRQLHLFHRFTQTHPDIQLIAVHSQEESPKKIIDFKIENGWYFPFAQSNILPNQLPQTIIHINEQDLYLDGSIHYERLLEIFERDH